MLTVVKCVFYTCLVKCASCFNILQCSMLKMLYNLHIFGQCIFCTWVNEVQSVKLSFRVSINSGSVLTVLAAEWICCKLILHIYALCNMHCAICRLLKLHICPIRLSVPIMHLHFQIVANTGGAYNNMICTLHTCHLHMLCICCFC